MGIKGTRVNCLESDGVVSNRIQAALRALCLRFNFALLGYSPMQWLPLPTATLEWRDAIPQLEHQLLV